MVNDSRGVKVIGETSTDMKWKTFLLGGAFLGALTAVRAEDQPADLVRQGQQLLEKNNCEICHAVDGRGGKHGMRMNRIADRIPWSEYAHDAQHSALSPVARYSQGRGGKHWRGLQ